MSKYANLLQYLERRNRINLLFNSAEYDLKNAEDRVEIRKDVECDLSPENLTCDGELPYEKVLAKRVHLENVLKELDRYDSIFGRLTVVS